MRIISQNRENDVNYDRVQIVYKKCNDSHTVIGVLGFFEDGDKCCILGSYATKERCLEVMESIRTSYMHDKKVFLMPEE